MNVPSGCTIDVRTGTVHYPDATRGASGGTLCRGPVHPHAGPCRV